MTQTRNQINEKLVKMTSDKSKVFGLYCGFKFSGIATECRQNTMSYDIEMKVALDSPIKVFGAERTTITVDGGQIYKDNGNGHYEVFKA